MLNADDILGEEPKRRVMMRGLNQLRKVRKPRNERPETVEQERRGIPHDHQAALEKAAERRKTRGARRTQSFAATPKLFSTKDIEWTVPVTPTVVATSSESPDGPKPEENHEKSLPAKHAVELVWGD